MTRLFRAALASSLLFSTVALAQNIEMKVQVDEEDMPSANIDIRASDDEEGASVRVRGGGARMKVKVTGDSGEVQVRQRVEVVEEEDRRDMHAPRHAPPPAYRDCGTQRDSGCTMTRDGNYPMDAEAFRGFLKALKSQSNEILREEMAGKVLARNYLTAAQFGLVLDQFQNEITRLDVARTAAPHVVNPQHALGFSSKWSNSISAEEYVELISQQ